MAPRQTVAELMQAVRRCGFEVVLNTYGPAFRRLAGVRQGVVPAATVAELKARHEEVVAWLRNPPSPEAEWVACEACHAHCRADLWSAAPALCPQGPKACPLNRRHY